MRKFYRIILFFDLPTITSADRRNYRLFVKFLKKNGFYMMQESIYCKILVNEMHKISIRNLIRNNCPPQGLVQFMFLSEKQYQKIETIVGAFYSEVLTTADRIVYI